MIFLLIFQKYLKWQNDWKILFTIEHKNLTRIFNYLLITYILYTVKISQLFEERKLKSKQMTIFMQQQNKQAIIVLFDNDVVQLEHR